MKQAEALTMARGKWKCFGNSGGNGHCTIIYPILTHNFIHPS